MADVKSWRDDPRVVSLAERWHRRQATEAMRRTWQTELFDAVREWRQREALRAMRRQVRAENSKAFREHVGEIQQALVVLERALVDPACVIGDGRERRQANRHVEKASKLFRSWIDRYSVALTPTDARGRPGPGRPKDIVFRRCREVLATRDVERVTLTHFLVRDVWKQITDTERLALFGTLDPSEARKAIPDKLVLREKTTGKNRMAK